jgi:hypothetical protein
MSAIPPLMPGSLNLATLEVDKAKIKTLMGDVLSSLNTWKETVRLATTTAVASLTGLPIIDGVQTLVGDRVLLKNEPDVTVLGVTTNANGIYKISTLAWKRTADLPVGAHAAGVAIFVTEGTVNADKVLVCTNDFGSDVVNTDLLVFSSLVADAAGQGTIDQIQVSDGAGGVVASAATATVAGLVTAGTGLVATTGGVTATAGDIVATLGGVTAETGLSIGADANQSMGTSGSMTAGTIVVGNTYVAAGDYIFLTHDTIAGAPGSLSVVITTPGTIFTINSSSATDTSTVRYLIVRPVV